jgi:hypothetical protein
MYLKGGSLCRIGYAYTFAFAFELIFEVLVVIFVISGALIRQMRVKRERKGRGLGIPIFGIVSIEWTRLKQFHVISIGQKSEEVDRNVDKK